MTRHSAEALACALLTLLACLGSLVSLGVALERAHALTDVPVLQTVSAARMQALGAIAVFAVGMLLLIVARIRSVARGRRNLWVGAMLPAMTALAGIGLVSQMGHGDPLRWAAWPGPGFAVGLGLGAMAAALVLGAPLDPIDLLRRYRVPLALVVVLGCVGLRLFGSGPTGSNTFINLDIGPWTVQPLEAIKLAFVCLLGLVLGEHAVQLRFQRERAWLLRFPRPKLLSLATFFLLTLFAGLVLLVHDLGPTLVLSLVFLALFYIATRSTGWVFVSIAVIAGGIFAIVSDPRRLGSEILATRIDMWLNPWFNGLSYGSQLAESLWAFAAGGMWGQGLAQAQIGAVSAAHTDLMLPHLAEETGFLGGLLYLALFGVLVLQGLWAAANNREPERVLVGAACALLLFCQWLVIFGGVTGLLPLTGLAAPFLSWGKSSTVVFMLTIGILLRIAEDGSPRVVTRELAELRGTMTRVMGTAGVAMVGAAGVLFWLGVVKGSTHTSHGVLETLRDGTMRVSHDPRLEAIVRRIGRGEILDRNGQTLAATDRDGRRVYPLGDALGTLLGPPRSERVMRRSWSLERIHDHHLRGYPERPVRPGAWTARRPDGSVRLLFAVPDGNHDAGDADRARKLAAGAPVRFVRFSAPDFDALTPLVRMRASARARAVDNLIGRMPERSIRLTLDADLQRAVADVLHARAVLGEAAAAVVIDVASGQVLARAQYPDVDFSDDAWVAGLEGGDPKFAGVYGPWIDKTGIGGYFQAGSVAKLFTALAAVRGDADFDTRGAGCAIRSIERFPCVARDRKGPYFNTKGWPMPVHDHYSEDPHGSVDLVEGLAESCNVFFAQLGLKLGPGSFRSLFHDGVEIGWHDDYDPGDAGSRRLASTAFGQGAAAMNVSQAARLVAAIGAGGTYRRCSSNLLYDADCEDTTITANREGVRAILAGMRRAVTHGTAAVLPRVRDVRVYGKTGTADSVAVQDEAPYGYRPGAIGLKPHSWFLALAESATRSGCQADGAGRLAVAVVIPRGGGGTVAGAAAIDIIKSARQLGYFGG